MADPLLGRLVGDWQVTARLSRGEANVIYRVRHRMLKIDRTMQVVRPFAAEVLDNILREAQLLGAIRHRNLVRVHEAGALEGGDYYLLTELLNGEALTVAIHRAGRLPVREALKVLRDVSAGLAEAHERGVVHRSIRPDSIFLAREGGVSVAKLIDFGLAFPCSQEGVRAIAEAATYPGGARYAAPEQLGLLSARDVVDARADVYSLGLSLYETLTGQVPFAEASPAASLDDRLHRAPEPPSVLVPDAGIEPELDSLVMRMIAVERVKRPKDAREVSAQLDRFLLGVRRPSPGRAAAPETVSRKRTRERAPEADRSGAGEPRPTREEVAPARQGAVREASTKPAAREVAAARPPAREVAVARPPAREAAPAESPVREAASAKAPARETPVGKPPIREVVDGAVASARPSAPTRADLETAAPKPVESHAVGDAQRRTGREPSRGREGEAESERQALEERLLSFAHDRAAPERVGSRPGRPLIIGAAVGVVAVVVVVAWALLARAPSPAVESTRAVSGGGVVASDIAARRLDEALASRDRSKIRAWLRTFPRSALRERAYLALLEVGSTADEVCGHARENSPALLEGNGELAGVCRREQ